MKKILIIEDDISIAEIERDFLEINGYETKIISDGREGMEEALKGDYTLILLDVMLPSMDGFEVCKNIRDEIDIPILMVTAKIEDIDKIRGLGFGADDYISKPFSLPELIARVKSNISQYERLRKTSTNNDKKGLIQIKNISINSKTRMLYVNDKEVKCKTKEFDLLHFLMLNPEIVFSKETLYERVWGLDAFGDIKTVVVHINRLRDKIEKDPSHPDYIQTVWGAGYKFKI